MSKSFSVSKRLLAIVATLCMLLTMIPTMPFVTKAAEESVSRYDTNLTLIQTGGNYLYVDGSQITFTNAEKQNKNQSFVKNDKGETIGIKYMVETDGSMGYVIYTEEKRDSDTEYRAYISLYGAQITSYNDTPDEPGIGSEDAGIYTNIDNTIIDVVKDSTITKSRWGILATNAGANGSIGGVTRKSVDVTSSTNATLYVEAGYQAVYVQRFGVDGNVTLLINNNVKGGSAYANVGLDIKGQLYLNSVDAEVAICGYEKAINVNAQTSPFAIKLSNTAQTKQALFTYKGYNANSSDNQYLTSNSTFEYAKTIATTEIVDYQTNIKDYQFVVMYHEHSTSENWEETENGEEHYQLCDSGDKQCGDRINQGKHTPEGDVTPVDDDQHKQICSVCSLDCESAHNYEVKHDDAQHYNYCEDCKHTSGSADHEYDTLTLDRENGTWSQTCKAEGCGNVKEGVLSVTPLNGYSLKYTGEAQELKPSITLKQDGNVLGTTVTYSFDEDFEEAGELCSVTNAGEYTLYCKVELAGAFGVMEIPVKVAKEELNVSLQNVNATRGDKLNDVTAFVTVSDFKGADTLESVLNGLKATLADGEFDTLKAAAVNDGVAVTYENAPDETENYTITYAQTCTIGVSDAEISAETDYTVSPENGKWSTDAYTVSLKDGSAFTEMSLTGDDDSWTSEPITFGEAGEYTELQTQTVYFKNQEGKVAVVTLTYGIDNADPVATLTVNGVAFNELNLPDEAAEYTYIGSYDETVVLNAEDSQSGIASMEIYVDTFGVDETPSYKNIDDITDWKPYDGAFTVDADGRYIVYAKVTDNVGKTKVISSNVLEWNTQVPVISDVKITHLVDGESQEYDGSWSEGDFTIELTCENIPDIGVTYQYSEDGGNTWSNFLDPQQPSFEYDLESCEKEMVFRAVSNSGVKSAPTSTYILKADSITPNITLVQPGSGKEAVQDAILDFAISTGASKYQTVKLIAEVNGVETVTDITNIEYAMDVTGKLNDHISYIFGGGVDYNVTENGTYQIRVTNGAGKTAVSNTVEVKNIDREKPVVVVKSFTGLPEGQEWYTGDVTVTLGNSANNIGIPSYYYRQKGTLDWILLDSDSETPTLRISGDGIWDYEFYAISKACVESDVCATAPTFKIDTTVAEVQFVVGEEKSALANFVSAITFDLFDAFFNSTTAVTVLADDKPSGVALCEYYIHNMNNVLPDEIPYVQGDSFTLEPNAAYILFARVTDVAGNVVCVRSDEVELDDGKTLDRVVVDNETVDITTTDNSWDSDKWTNEGGTVTVKLPTELSGVKEVYYAPGALTDQDLSKVENASVVSVKTTDTECIIEISVDNYNGQYSIWYRDYAGNVSTAPYLVDVRADNVKPEIGKDVTVSPSAWTNGSVDVTLTVTDPEENGVYSDVYEVCYQKKDAAAVHNVETVDSAGDVVISLQAQDYKGEYIFWCVDRAGNESERVAVWVQMDHTAPVVAEPVATPGDWTKNSVTIKGVVSDTLSGVKCVEYRRADEEWSGLYATLGDDDFTFTVEAQDYCGNYEIRAWDEADNVSEVSEIAVKMDITVPSITLDNYVEGEQYWVNKSVPIEGTFEDNLAGVVEVYYLQSSSKDETVTEDTEGTLLTEITADDDTNKCGTFRYTITQTDYYYFWAKDQAGNMSKVLMAHAKIDNQAPNKVVVTNIDDLKKWTRGNLTVKGTVSDNGKKNSKAGVTEVYYLQGDHNAVTDMASLASGAQKTETTNGNEYYNFTIEAQNYSGKYTLWCKDAAGNYSAPTTIDVNMDVQVPNPVSIQVSENPILKVIQDVTFGFYKAPVTVTITATDADKDGEGNEIAPSGIASIDYGYDGQYGFQDPKTQMLSENETNAEVSFDIDKEFVGKIWACSTDNAGNPSDTVETFFDADGTQYSRIAVDLNPPKVNITYSGDDGKNVFYRDENGVSVDSFADAEKLYTNGSIIATITVEESNFFTDQVDVQVLGQDGLPVNDGVTVEWDGKTCTVTIQNDGEYTLEVCCTDYAGNEAIIRGMDQQDTRASYKSKPLVKDTVLPTKPEANLTFEKTPPVNDPSWTNGMITVSGGVQDDFSGVLEVVYKQGKNGEETLMTVNGETYSFEIPAQNYQGDFYVYAIDKAGNRSEETVAAVYMDVTVPEVTDGKAQPDTWTNGAVVIEGAVNDPDKDKKGETIVPSDINRVEYCRADEIDDGKWPEQPDTATYADGKYSFTVDKQDYQGDYVIRVWDNAGNVSEEYFVAVEMDAMAPKISTVVANPDVYTNQFVVVSGTINNLSGENAVGKISPIYAVEYKKGQGNTWTDQNTQKATFEYDEVTKTATYQFVVSEENYNGGYLIRCRDEAGNESELASTHLHMDIQHPIVESINANPSNWTNGNVTITGIVRDAVKDNNNNKISPSGIQTVYYKEGEHKDFDSETCKIAEFEAFAWESETDIEGNKIVDENGEPLETIVVGADYSFTVDAQDYHGLYTVWTVDVAGNISDPVTIEVKMDVTAPVVQSGVADPSVWTNGDVVIIGNVADEASGLDRVQYCREDKINDDNWEEAELTVDGLTGTYTFTVDKQDYKGNYAIRVWDKAGTVSEVFSVSVQMDITPPQAPVVTFNKTIWNTLLDQFTLGFFNETVEVTIKAEDPQSDKVASGIKEVRYSFAGTKSLFGEDVDPGLYKGTVTVEEAETLESVFTLSIPAELVESKAEFMGNFEVYAIDYADNESGHTGTGSGKNENGESVDIQTIVVDNVAPEVDIRYESLNAQTDPFRFVDNSNNTVDSFDKADRVYCGEDILVTLTVTEGNFYEEDITVSVTKDGEAYETMLSVWTTEGITHTATMMLEGDGDYLVSVNYTDRSTNEAAITAGDGNAEDETVTASYTSKLLVIDHTAPVIESVTYDNNTVINTIDGRQYFDKVRTATITIVDHNFRADEVELFVKAQDVVGANLMAVAEDTDYVQSYIDLGADRSKWTAYEKDAFRSKDDRYVLTVAYKTDANYTFDMTYTDLAGNEIAKEYTEERFTVDTTAPTGLTVGYSAHILETILNKITFGFYNAKMTVTISAQDDVAGVHHFLYSYIKGQGVSAVNAQLLNEAIAAAQITYDGARATTSFTIPKLVLDNAAQFNGTVEFTAFDRSENSTKMADNKTIVVDNIRPQIEVSYNTPVQTVNNISYYDGNITATVHITEANFYAEDVKVTVTKDGAAYPVSVNWTNESVDSHIGTFTLTADGDYVVAVSYTDRSNNAMQDYRSNQLTIDTVIPTITVSNVKNASANADEVYTFTITADDTNLNPSTLVATIKAIVRNDKGLFEEITVPTGDLYTITSGKTYAYTVENLEADAIYTMSCTVSDFAGHTYSNMVLDDAKEYSTVQFSINRDGSAFTLDEYTMGVVKTYYVHDLTKDIVVIETNADPLSEYHVTLNGEKLRRGTDYTVKEEGGNGQWMKYTYSISKSLFMEEGEYQLFISSKDKVGNDAFSDVKNAGVHFFVDRTAPIVTFTGLEDGGRYQTEAQTVTVIPTDDGGALSSLFVQLVDNNGNVLEELLNLSGEALQKALEEGNGMLTFTIKEGALYQNVRVVCKDAADEATGESNVYDYTFTDVSVSSSAFMIFWANKTLRWGVIIGGTVLIGLIIFLLIFKRRKKDDEKTA